MTDLELAIAHHILVFTLVNKAWSCCTAVANSLDRSRSRLSVMPTIAFVKWRRAAKTNPAFTPEETALARIRAYIAAELALVPVILICAAAMARYGGF